MMQHTARVINWVINIYWSNGHSKMHHMTLSKMWSSLFSYFLSIPMTLSYEENMFLMSFSQIIGLFPLSLLTGLEFKLSHDGWTEHDIMFLCLSVCPIFFQRASAVAISMSPKPKLEREPTNFCFEAWILFWQLVVWLGRKPHHFTSLKRSFG